MRPARLLARGIPTGRGREGTLKVEGIGNHYTRPTGSVWLHVLYLPDNIQAAPSGVIIYRAGPIVLIWVELLSPFLCLAAVWPVMGFSTALLALAHVLAANAACDSLPSCGTCLANSGCGWCASSTSCMSIASDGTVEGTCSDFQGSQCVGGSRDSKLLSHAAIARQAVPIGRLNSASA